MPFLLWSFAFPVFLCDPVDEAFRLTTEKLMGELYQEPRCRKSPGNCERSNHSPAATAAAHVNVPNARASKSARRLPSSITIRVTCKLTQPAAAPISAALPNSLQF